MATTNRMETSLLTEHLRFTPLTLLDDIINTINEVVTRAVDAAESGLLVANPANLGFDKRAEREGTIPDTDEDGNLVYPEAKAEIEEGLHKLETLLGSNVDRNFDKFEIWVLRNVLYVPEELVPWVRLGHYEGIKLPTATEGLVTAEKVQGLQQRLRQTRKLNSALEATARRNSVALDQLRSLVEIAPSEMKVEQASLEKEKEFDRAGAYSFLTNGHSAKKLGLTPITASLDQQSEKETTGPLETNTSFTMSQLPALRALLDDLRPKLTRLGDAQAAASESHMARERRIYLNNQARNAVERQGVEIGGSAEGLGRRVQGDEVTALESIADGLGTGREDEDKMEE